MLHFLADVSFHVAFVFDITSAAVRSFALKCLGASEEHAVAREVELGLYSIELPEAGDAPVKPAKK